MGFKGSKDGQFSIPYSMAMDNSDNIYVADRENKKLNNVSKTVSILGYSIIVQDMTKIIVMTCCRVDTFQG